MPETPSEFTPFPDPEQSEITPWPTSDQLNQPEHTNSPEITTQADAFLAAAEAQTDSMISRLCQLAANEIPDEPTKRRIFTAVGALTSGLGAVALAKFEGNSITASESLILSGSLFGAARQAAMLVFDEVYSRRASQKVNHGS